MSFRFFCILVPIPYTLYHILHILCPIRSTCNERDLLHSLPFSFSLSLLSPSKKRGHVLLTYARAHTYTPSYIHARTYTLIYYVSTQDSNVFFYYYLLVSLSLSLSLFFVVRFPFISFLVSSYIWGCGNSWNRKTMTRKVPLNNSKFI